MRMILCGVAIQALVACAPAIPESGVGFADYDSYQKTIAAREAQLSRQVIPGPNVVSNETLAPSTPVTVRTAAATPRPDAADVAAETQAALAATRANSGRVPLDASPSNPAPVQLNNPGISDENSFEAVGSRRTIQSDAERIAQNRAQYQVIAPTALPTRTAATGPNLAEYALKTTNAVGQSIYRRVNFNADAKYLVG